MEVVLPDPCLVILCGPAGCGKSTFARAHFVETAVVSSDRCRALIADDEREMRVSGAAFALFHQIIDSRLRFRRLTVADSTALQPDARRELRRIARRWKTPTALLVFDIPEETCVQWNARRGRQVARAVIHRQWQEQQNALRRVPQEGYGRVVVLGPADVAHASVQIER